MTNIAPAPVEDHSELRSRAQSVEIGSRLKLASVAASLAYAIATWGSPHRTLVVALIGATFAWTFVPLLVGGDRIVRSARRESLFLGWSVGSVLLSGALMAADGGAGSPYALLLFLPLAFAALSYPLKSVAAIGALDVLVFAAVGLAEGSASQPRLAFFSTCLAVTALLCAWEALDHDRQREALARVSRADPLTGCLNRRGFEERLEAELDSGTRSGGRVALVLLDLDDFKAVNDSRGHAAGDELLCWTVEQAALTLRPMDSLGRLGGDEFAILVPGAGSDEAREVAARIRAALAERVSVSAGVASFPADGADRETLHRRADADLYDAKRGGGAATGREPTSRDLTFATALARAVNLRMSMPAEHSPAVSHYAVAIAERLGFADRELAVLRMAATLHDVGKVSVPDRILRKPGPLTIEEYEQVKVHAGAGAEIVGQIDGLAPVADWIRHSHEHFDGSGYPDGLCGEDIPLGSRVLLVADAFDAVTSSRPYGPALPPELAIEELHMGVGRQFDARCVSALADYIAEHPADVRLLAGRGAKRFGRGPAPSAAPDAAGVPDASVAPLPAL
jgi:diguanylate cyclase (GGDEF)-like protein/putative nucleotidyltransferase with HDIG domain